MDVDNHIESHIIFHHLESTIAVRCLARNDMGAVSREVKLVSNGKRPVFVYLGSTVLIVLSRPFISSVLSLFSVTVCRG